MLSVSLRSVLGRMVSEGLRCLQLAGLDLQFSQGFIVGSNESLEVTGLRMRVSVVLHLAPCP